ncbi:MAG: GNAT family N-acetyltransferase [Pseudomonadota bacterium]
MKSPRIWTTARGDAAHIVDLEARAFGARSWGAQSLAETLAAPLARVILISSDPTGPAQGFLIWRHAGDEAEILTLGVEPSSRRAGLARTLVEAFVETAQEEGAGAAMLEVGAANHPARALYESAGFIEVGRRPRYYRDGDDALVLRKSF